MFQQVAKEYQNRLFFQGEPTKRNSTRPSSFAEHIPSSSRSAINRHLQKSGISQQTSSEHKKNSLNRGQIFLFEQKIAVDYQCQQSVFAAIKKIENCPKIRDRTKLGLQIVILKRGQEVNKKLTVPFESIIQKYEKELQDIVK